MALTRRNAFRSQNGNVFDYVVISLTGTGKAQARPGRQTGTAPAWHSTRQTGTAGRQTRHRQGTAPVTHANWQGWAIGTGRHTRPAQGHTRAHKGTQGYPARVVVMSS